MLATRILAVPSGLCVLALTFLFVGILISLHHRAENFPTTALINHAGATFIHFKRRVGYDPV